MAVATGTTPVVRPGDATRASRDAPRTLGRIGAGILAVLLLAPVVIAFCVGWRAFAVRSPSMGRTAPVGALVITEPVATRSIRVGDVISFRPSGEHGAVYTHRVVATESAGFRTRGDINGAEDAWTVRPKQVVGLVRSVVPGIGWLLRLAPWVAIAMVVIWFATWPIRSATVRAGARLLGACAAVTTTSLVLRPIAGCSVLTTAPAPGGQLATVVATGLLPVRISARGGGSALLVPGEVTRLLLPATSDGQVRLDSALGLDPFGWCCVALVCALPLLGMFLVGLPAGEESAKP